MRNFIKFIFKDFQWKLLSFGLAYIVWITGTNAEDLYKNITHTRKLELSGIELLESNNIRVLNKDDLVKTDINVNIRAKTSEHNLINVTPPAIQPSVDLRDVIISEVLNSDVPIQQQLSVNVNITHGERMSLNPTTVSVILDKYIRKDFEIKINEIGEADPEHELIETESFQKTVTVSAAQSILNEVYEVRATVDLNNAAESFTSQADLIAFDKNGQDITAGVELSFTETSIHATIYPQKEVPLSIGHTGRLANNHVVTETIITPETVLIIGPESVLEEINVIELAPLDLTNHNMTYTTSVSIEIAPESSEVKLKTGQPAEAGVIYTIEPLQMREFLLPSYEIGIVGNSGLAVRLQDQEPVRITVQGPSSAVNEMSLSDIGGTLDLNGLETGEHSVPLRISLPEGIGVVGTPMVNIEITEATENQPGQFPWITSDDGHGNQIYINAETGEPIGIFYPDTEAGETTFELDSETGMPVTDGIDPVTGLPLIKPVPVAEAADPTEPPGGEENEPDENGSPDDGGTTDNPAAEPEETDEPQSVPAAAFPTAEPTTEPNGDN